MSLPWREGNNGGDRHRSFSNSSIDRTESLSLDCSSTNGDVIGFSRDMSNGRRASRTNVSFEWLQPWRTPQDCREGGVAILYTVQEVLATVRQVRKTNMGELYAVRTTGSSSASTTGLRHPQHLDLPRVANGGGGSSSSSAGGRMGSVSQRSQRNVSFAERVPSGSNDKVQGREPATAVEAAPPLDTPPPPFASAAAVPPIVPAIPRFEEVTTEQELIHRRQQLLQQPHPRSEAAHCKCRALVNSDDDEDTARSPRHPGGSCPSGGCDRTARPGDLRHRPGMNLEWTFSDSNGEELESLTQRRNASGVSTDEDDADASGVYNREHEALVEEADRLSETDFGEGGHLDCMPGDTLHQRYTLLKALGVGHSSRVWLAVDLEQCSLARSQLIRELGEREVRRLFMKSEQPMFVAIKVFRCDPMYADWVTYESKLTTLIHESLRWRWQQQQQQQRCPFTRASHSASLPFSPTAMPAACDGHGGDLHESSDVGENSVASHLDGAAGRTRPHPTSSTPCSATTCATAKAFSRRLATVRDAFTVDGAFGTHHCLVMDVLGASVDRAINEAHLDGFPSAVARTIVQSALQGLVLLAACHLVHTGLRPESLFFTDLEADVAEEMRTFQSAQPPRHDDGGTAGRASVDPRSPSSDQLLPGQASAIETAACLHTPHAVSDGVVGEVSHLPSLVRTPGQRRSAYDTRLSGLGLSVVVPPCLRLGVRLLNNYATRTSDRGGMTADELVRQDPLQQLRWLYAQQQARLLRLPGDDDDDVVSNVADPWRGERWRLADTDATEELPPPPPPPPMPDIGLSEDLMDEADLRALELQERPESDADGGRCAASLSMEEYEAPEAADCVGVSAVGDAEDAHRSTTRAGSGQRASLVAVQQRLLAPCPPEGWATPQNQASVSTRVEGVADASHTINSSNDGASPAGAVAATAATALRRLECDIIRHQNYSRGAVVQSREYRAPEVLLGNFILPSCDIWSMGCIAYELVSGRLLFDCVADRQRFAAELSSKQQHGKMEYHASGGVHDARGDSLDKWDGRPIYLDDPEQDLDVFHLKAVMRLLGPPPLSFLRQPPMGLFVDDFFDEHGSFRFWERGEAAAAGLCLADPYRELELAYEASSAMGSGAGQQQDRPVSQRVSGGEAPSLGRDPRDTMNYPIRTPGWQEVQAILREKLGSAEEAADFERFLRRCLQWDPARRATAAELLAHKWVVKYSSVVADASEA
ncbi:protein kinase, putative [Leishmania tarentolae]|uniref:non-specific serine/threonine protein kinase n=1 Tax=Leishmania tarentolae TaxID=5689 RepID=A0A640KD34_LEITA|nr:protein kinase, putative [Leishmania tarentolae]